MPIAASSGDTRLLRSPLPHQVVKIPQGDRGRNWEGFAMVNESLQSGYGWTCNLLGFDTYVARNPHLQPIVRRFHEILLTVRACTSFGSRAGRKGCLRC